ncbi:MAG: hypothetical protein RBS72_04510 [Sedimentisphaerales bacterium]|nr:hypothetical protein [Sedimentisphaerales bacterium]HNY77620.1 hypothetical protein [Sedimentisphaerales bacterium]HOC61953.1 hypothetical protein [Sedimentisphaerales bacterium]HOH63795.1 hypothetical protein [Sedimentisphaerales bacterium]HPY48301.1 hypothetical protein [Sedimentisphaerales bacterium]
MSTMLDSQALFDERDLRIAVGPIERASIERSMAGLDGLASIDLGLRGRKIRQRGTLRAASRAQMDARIAAIEGFLDGAEHTLRTADGRQYDDLRMDAFTPLGGQVEGTGLVVEYEITYTQLRS